ncbi:MAG: glycosyltransferase family 1 protein [Candidatus Omnitrophica bacterium]|nr:glycosyltransferase family 1 protein [Candidatus Omnitrophota bacterium]
MPTGKIALVYREAEQMTVGAYWRRAFFSLGFEVVQLNPEEFHQIPLRADWLIRVDDGRYAADPLEKVMKIKQLPPSCYYAIDTHFPRSLEKNAAIAQCYQRVFCAQYNGVSQLKKKEIKAEWLPLACDPDFHKKQLVAKKYDIGFVGGDHLDGPRKYILQELRERYPDSYVDQAPSDQMSRIYSSAKIGINLSAAGDVNMRFFEILACGTLLLTDRIKDNGLEYLGFEEEKHYVGYSSFKEMFDKIRYYLDHEQERETIASTGHLLVRERHTYAERIKKVLLDVLPGRTSGVL